MNTFAEVYSRGLMARERLDRSVMQQKRRSRMLESWLESSERPTAVVGENVSGKSGPKTESDPEIHLRLEQISKALGGQAGAPERIHADR